MNIAGLRSDTDSPCTGVCSATALGDLVCTGCKRTAIEVREWNAYTDEQKRAVNRRLRGAE